MLSEQGSITYSVTGMSLQARQAQLLYPPTLPSIALIPRALYTGTGRPQRKSDHSPFSGVIFVGIGEDFPPFLLYFPCCGTEAQRLLNLILHMYSTHKKLGMETKVKIE
jgi:hypothetical protein